MVIYTKYLDTLLSTDNLSITTLAVYGGTLDALWCEGLFPGSILSGHCS